MPGLVLGLVPGLVLVPGLALVLELEQEFGARLDARFVPGATYRVRLHLEIWELRGAGPLAQYQKEVDFGFLPMYLPWTDRHARYDSIEICLGEPDKDDEILARLDDLESQIQALIRQQAEERQEALQKEHETILSQVV